MLDKISNNMRTATPIIILIFSLLGIGLTSFLTYQHYYAAEICNINQFFSCDAVNKSIYSEFLGIPVAVLGLIYFATVACLSFSTKKKNTIRIFFLSLVSIVPSAVLTYIELFVLHAACIVCESTKVLIIAIMIISYFSFKRAKTRP